MDELDWKGAIHKKNGRISSFQPRGQGRPELLSSWMWLWLASGDTGMPMRVTRASSVPQRSESWFFEVFGWAICILLLTKNLGAGDHVPIPMTRTTRTSSTEVNRTGFLNFHDFQHAFPGEETVLLLLQMLSHQQENNILKNLIWWPKSGLGSDMNSCEPSTCVLKMDHHVWCFNPYVEGLEFHLCCLSAALENSMFLLVKPSLFVASHPYVRCFNVSFPQ